MLFYHIFLLAVIQGLTEFLPVSSSAHLILGHSLFDAEAALGRWEDDILLDLAVHVGTLFSALVYFRRDIGHMFLGLRDWSQKDFQSEDSNLLLCVIVGSIPVIIAGFLLFLWQPDFLRSIEIIAWTTVIFAVFLWLADKYGQDIKNVKNMRLRDALIVGLAQVLSLIPGASRSGVTMTAARYLGFSRIEAARYSLLLAIVAVSGAGFLGGLSLWMQGDMALTAQAALAMVIAFFAGWAAIAGLMKWLSFATFTPFVIYRLILGGALLYIVYLV